MMDFEQVAWVSAQSPGTTQWVTMDLDAGQVMLPFFVTDPKADDAPHAFEGMMELVDVGAN